MKHFILLISLITLASPAMATHGHPHDITVKVNGLVCDFCARSVEKLLGAREEVNSTHVDLDKKEVVIDLKDGKTIDDAEIKKLITDSGYDVVSVTHGS